MAGQERVLWWLAASGAGRHGAEGLQKRRAGGDQEEQRAKRVAMCIFVGKPA
jgi:hypothetical protein